LAGKRRRGKGLVKKTVWGYRGSGGGQPYSKALKVLYFCMHSYNRGHLTKDEYN